MLWKQLRHPNVLPFYGAYVADQFGMVSPWLGDGNIVQLTKKNPEVDRLRLVRCSQQSSVWNIYEQSLIADRRGTRFRVSASRWRDSWKP